MSVATLTFDHLKAQAASVRQRVQGANRIGIHTFAKWTEGAERVDSELTYRIHQCDSPLAFRQALSEGASDMTVHLLLTPLEERDLGDEILLRLAKQRLFSIDRWQIIRSLFNAKAVDPRLLKQTWLAEEVLHLSAKEITAAAPGGFLDEETVWSILLERRIGLQGSRPDVSGILAWSLSEENVALFLRVSREVQEGIIKWCEQFAGLAGRAIFEFLMRGKTSDAAPLGHVLGVIFRRSATDAGVSSLARAEERYLGGHELSQEVIQHWASAATSVITQQGGESSRRLVARIDEVLAAVKAQDLARLSDLSPMGFTSRLDDLGVALCEALGKATILDHDVDNLSALLRSVERHGVADKHRRRVCRCQMAVRLVRWLRATQATRATPTSFSCAALMELAEGSFLDWARLSLRYTETVESLAKGYNMLSSRLGSTRETDAEEFAQLLQGWLAAGASEETVICIESVLDRIVVPAVNASPVLIVLLDGMSGAVYQELLDDLHQKKGWVPIQRIGSPASQPIIAGIPSITEVSRCSLFSGKLMRGGQSVERQGFSEHRGLLAVSGATAPPLLFHKASLQDETGLSADLRKEVALRRKVVAVVLNAIDDQLLNGDQLDIEWKSESIRIFDALLEVAKNSGRLVILLSDHGHIFENGSQDAAPASGEFGARWRPADGSIRQGESEVRGARVLSEPSRALIMPWSEKVRYGPKRSGYHGGVNPQELVLPAVVLCGRDRVPSEWQELGSSFPSWWDLSDSDFLLEPLAVPLPIVIEEEQSQTPSDLFFDQDWRDSQATVAQSSAGSSAPSWIRDVLASPLYDQQKRVCGRTVPSDVQVKQFITCLSERGGSTTLSALSRQINYPKMRLPGFLALLQRLLNVDGYPILSKDDAADKIELNIAMLKQQFGVEAGA